MMVAEKNQNKNVYNILVILTCGNIHDKTKTLDIIKRCYKKIFEYKLGNKIPISIIIVGLGENNFSLLENLNSEQKSE